MASKKRVIAVKVICSDLPAPNWGGHSEIWIGIQNGKEVVQQVKLPTESVVFEFELEVSNDESDPVPNFLGPYAQGGKGDRFVYICWGMPYFGRWSGFRRAKIPLAGLDWVSIKSNSVTCKLKCTDAKVGPICATVKPDYIVWSPAE